MSKKYSVVDVITMLIDGNSSDVEQLGEDEDDEEEWTPNAMVTEESSDSSDEDFQDESVNQTSADTEGPSLPDENVDQMSTDVEGPTLQDKITNQTAKGKVKRKEYRGRKGKFEPPSAEFNECVEEALEDGRCNWTPYMYLKLFVTDKMLQEIAEQTNIYSVQF